ncbi:hypothetical protein HPB47_011509 [Ixodes persulcatus]|uniref:Uncharacterized protein n=1 Tax=Ixodes persulcatus TaxID=34615 RepID=A0AC60NWA8_IXOPE|nr:hypothetical protein HPB47_011509 [Ixodes persulcatus]
MHRHRSRGAGEVRRACAVGERDVAARAPCEKGRRGALLVGMRCVKLYRRDVRRQNSRRSNYSAIVEHKVVASFIEAGRKKERFEDVDCSCPRCGLTHRAFSRCTGIDLAMPSGPPSRHSSHHVSTDQYSLSSSICGSSIAGLEDKDSPINTAEDITPGQQWATTSSRRVIVPTGDVELSDFDEPDWKDAKTRKTRKKTSTNSSLSAETVCSAAVAPEGFTVVFTPSEEGHVITSLSSLKLSLVLEKMFSECILKIRLNNRLNLIAVDVRNGQTTRGLPRCTVLCGIKVRAYEPVPRHCATGVIRDVDTMRTDEESTNKTMAKVQRSRSHSVDRRCQATFTSVMSGMQFHNSKRIHFNAVSVAAMDIERQPASAAPCANAAAARMRTETPALLKRTAQKKRRAFFNCAGHFGYHDCEQKFLHPPLTENQVPERPAYAALTKAPKSNKTKAPPTKQGPISPDLIQLEDPTTSGNTPADPRKRTTPKRKTPSVSTNTAPGKGWIPKLQTAAKIICKVLESIDTE